MSTIETVVRAFELPLNHAAKEVWPLLRECWRHAGLLSNWCVHQLACGDVVRTPDMAKLPKMPTVDLYALAFGRDREKVGRNDKTKVLPIVVPQYAGGEFFDGAKESAVHIMQKVREKYAQERFDVLWRRCRALETYRADQPWPVPSKMWKAAFFDGNGRPVVTVTLPGGTVELQLRGGPEFGRQIALFRQVVEGSMPRLQLVIRPQRVLGNCGRATIGEDRVMVKMVANVPVKDRPGDRTLTLITDPQSFWVAELDGRPAWVLNNDHVRRGVARHEDHLRRLQRLSQDAKAERRITGQRFKAAMQRLEDSSLKDRRRLDSWTHESAAHLVGYCVRQKVGEILYLDRDSGFCPRFPWHQLHSKLADKCALAGITFYSETQLRLSGCDPIEVTESDIRPTPEDEKWQRVSRLREMATRRLTKAVNRRGSHPAVSTA